MPHLVVGDVVGISGALFQFPDEPDAGRGEVRVGGSDTIAESRLEARQGARLLECRL